MKISSKLTPFKNFNRSLVLTFVTSIVIGIICYLSFQFLIYLGLFNSIVSIPAASDKDFIGQLFLASILVSVFFYVLVFLSIIFSNLAGLLILRLLKVDHSVKIVIMSLIIVLTLTLAYAMLLPSSTTPSWVILVTPPVAAYLISIFTIKILVDRNQRKKQHKLPHTALSKDTEQHKP